MSRWHRYPHVRLSSQIDNLLGEITHRPNRHLLGLTGCADKVDIQILDKASLDEIAGLG